MKKILLSVEGQTEEEFVLGVLRPHFEPECYLQPVVLKTSRSPHGQAHKGGVSTYSRIREDVRRLCHDTSAVVVSTMYDFYGLPKDFPGLQRIQPQWSSLQKVEFLESEFKQDIGDARFIPYLSLHEFEALLFSDREQLVSFLKQQGVRKGEVDTLKAVASPPEDIDSERPPSKRIQSVFAGYQKVLHGILIAQRIGIETMLQQCPHFRQWVDSLQRRCLD
ncbi:MAG: DUF4276 family protein [Fimbriimonadales bacterium]|nr:MAG: hypothetical protein KatS3mg018_2506 [Fimbriimonadales bacterium]